MWQGWLPPSHHRKKVLGLNSWVGQVPFCTEFVCSPNVCLGSLSHTESEKNIQVIVPVRSPVPEDSPD